jgi:purine-binding chemotaxis protein CheW
MSGVAHQPTQYVSFLIAGEEYAISILRAREIVEYDTLTRVPRAPHGVRGVWNLRGQVIPVIDLAEKLGLPPTEPSRWTCILIVEIEFGGERALMGMMIDAVSEVIDFMPTDIDPTPTFPAAARLDYLAGIGKVGKKLVMLLDIDRLLPPEELLGRTPLLPASLDLDVPASPWGSIAAPMAEAPRTGRAPHDPPLPHELSGTAAPVEISEGS